MTYREGTQCRESVGIISGVWESWMDHLNVLRGRAIRLTNGNVEEAEELLSSTIMKAANHVHRYPTVIRQPRAFFLHALKNEFITHCRRRKYEGRFRDIGLNVQEDNSDYLADSSPNQEEIFSIRELLKIVLSEVEVLPQQYRELFLMRFMEQKSYEDIAGELNISQQLARKRVQLLREKLVGLVMATHGDDFTQGNFLRP